VCDRGRLHLADSSERLHLRESLSSRNGVGPRQRLCHHIDINSGKCAGHGTTRKTRVTVDACA
jgi:hypothetical protein